MKRTTNNAPVTRSPRGGVFGVIGLIVVMLLALPGGGRAQIGNPQEQIAANPAGAYNLILMALSRQEYQKGLEIVDEVIRYWGPKAKEQFGPGFGHFYYLRGLLQMGLGRYPEAMGSFRTCREEFTNDLINVEGVRERPKLANRFRTHALAQEGACLMILGDYASAVEKLKGALAEAGDTQIRTDVIGLNLGRSYLRNGDLEQGRELLQKALDSQSLGLDLKRRAFMILAEDWSREVPFEEVQSLLWNYGHLVKEDIRAHRWERNPIFAFLGRNALEHQEPLRALTWYGFLLNPQELVAHRQGVLDQLNRESPRTPEDAASLEARKQEAATGIVEAESMVAAMLLGVGSGHYQLKNFSGAFAAFRQIADFYPEHRNRPDALYNLVASAVQLGLWPEARQYGRVFLDEYPEHPLVSEVARLMVESIYLLQEWQEAYTTAIEVRERFKIGEAARDVPDFVVAASLYHLDRFPEAEIEIEAYLKNYAEPRRLELATYYHGSTKVKLFQWQSGVGILESFMERWPRSDLHSSALYQAALCRFVLGEPDDALAKLDRLQAEFPNASEIPASWNLRGDVLVSKGGIPIGAIEAAYLEGRRLSEGIPMHFETAAYSFWKLVLLCAENQNHEDAVAYYDEFKKGYAKSGHELDVIAAALHSLVKVGRSREAEETVRNQIFKFADDVDSGNLSELFGSYLNFLDSHYPPDDVLAKIRTFPVPEPAPEPLTAWLRIAEIEKLEAREDPAQQEKAQQLFRRLATDLPMERMPDYPLIKLARWSHEQGDASRARAIYEYLLEQRPKGPHLDMARYDLASLLADSENSEDQDRAVNLYQQVRDESETPTLQEGAILGGGQLLMRQEKYGQAQTWWRDYLGHGNWLNARPEANFNYGRCLEETGSPKEALKIYTSVYALFPGHLDWSTQAYLRTAEILKKDKRDGDALLVLVDMLKRLGHLDHANIRKGRDLFAAWKEEWIRNQ
ncbi:MAG: tetratricopeptide repeat protein [Verrucomicrobiae bacterium]|nr:tetratricopeptide repeat protein [Verrucomicrobiae bacterium]